MPCWLFRENYTGSEAADIELPDQGHMNELYESVNALNIHAYFNVEVAPDVYNQSPQREIIRLLRNSVAHVNYEMIGRPPNWSMRFWNKNANGIVWAATCGVEDLEKLLLDLGNVLHAFYLEHFHAPPR